MEHFGFGKAFLHKCGESETNNLNFAFPLHLDDSASRRMRHLEDLVPGLKRTTIADAFRPILGWMQLQAFRKVARCGFSPGEEGIHRKLPGKSILKGYCSANVNFLYRSDLGPDTRDPAQVS